MDILEAAKMRNRFSISIEIQSRYYSNLVQPIGVNLEGQGSQLRENSVTKIFKE